MQNMRARLRLRENSHTQTPSLRDPEMRTEDTRARNTRMEDTRADLILSFNMDSN